MPIDWAKYGVDSSTPAKKDNITSVDFSKYVSPPVSESPKAQELLHDQLNLPNKISQTKPTSTYNNVGSTGNREVAQEPLPGRNIPIIGPIYKALDKFNANPIVKKADDIALSLYTPGAGLGNVASFAGAAENAVAKTVPKLVNTAGGRVAQKAATEAITGFPVAVGQSVANEGGNNPIENVKQGLYGAALGAAGPVLGAGLGKFAGTKIGQGLTNFIARNKGVAPETEQAVKDILSSAPEKPQTKFSNISGTLKPATQEQYLNKIMTDIKPEVMQRMTPPLENPNELAKWLKPHLGEASLNDVRKLSYADLTELANEVKNNMSTYDVAVQVAKEKGYDLPKVFDNHLPNIQQKVAQDASKRAYGIYDSPQLNIARPRPSELPENKPVNQAPTETLNIDNTPNETLDIDSVPNESVSNATDDLVDEAENYVVPRIRDKANSYADELIKSAKADLGSNRLSSNPLDIYGKLVAGYMLKGTVKLADLTEMLVREFGEGIRPHIRDIFQKAKEQYQKLKFQVETEELGLNGIDATKLKDVSNLNLNTSDVYRNFRNVFKNNYPQVKKAILDPFDEAKAQYVQEQKDLLKELRDNVVKKYGIQKGSKLSALVQKYGEQQITLDELKKQAPNKWEDVVKADAWFRKTYDELINKVNQTVQEIYPTRPEKIVPKRENYYRHFRELNGLSGLKNLFDTPSQIDPKLSGISPFTQPKTKWASFKQKRGLGEFKNDAVGGFLEYIPAASYAIHIDPQINVFRSLAKNLAEHTTDSRNVNNFIKFLNNFANDLSGKTSPFDRWVEEIGGRKTLSVLHWLNSRVKSNVILGNVRSSLSQLANIPQGIAFAKQYSIPGATRTMMSIFEPNPAMNQSKFLKERYLGKDFRKFDTDWLSLRNPLHTKKFAEWMMEFADRTGTSFIWNSAYAKAVSEKIEDPVKFADEETRRLVAGRGVGEVPLLQKSKVFQLIAPFQLEVANLWKIQKDFVSKKDFVGLVALYASSFLLNKAYEQVTGNGVVFDPIDAVTTALTEPDLSPLERFGRVGGKCSRMFR